MSVYALITHFVGYVIMTSGSPVDNESGITTMQHTKNWPTKGVTAAAVWQVSSSCVEK